MNEKDIIIKDNVEVSLDKVLQEAFKYMKSWTHTKINSYTIDGDKIRLNVEGDDSCIAVLKDRLGVENKCSNSIKSNVPTEQLKRNLYSVLSKSFEDITVNLNFIDTIDGDIIFVGLKVDIPTIPYPVNVKYKLYSDGNIDMAYRVYGDQVKQEVWVATSITMSELVKKLLEIETYYNKQPKQIKEDN